MNCILVIVIDNNICIPLGYHINCNGSMQIRYIVKVVIVDGWYKTTYPVLFDPVLLWHQNQMAGHPQGRMNGIPMIWYKLWTRQFGRKLTWNVFQCMEVEINALIHQVAQSLTSVANGIDSTTNYNAQIYVSQSQPHRMIYIPGNPNTMHTY